MNAAASATWLHHPCREACRWFVAMHIFSLARCDFQFPVPLTDESEKHLIAVGYVWTNSSFLRTLESPRRY